MIVHESIEIALLWSQFFADQSHEHGPLSSQPLKDYWTESRKRVDNWHEDLRLLRIQLESSGASRRSEIWYLLQLKIEEILISEVLTRVIATVTDALERLEIDTDSGSIAASVFNSHSEVRQRSLQLMVNGPGQPVEQAVSLNRLRFALEAITDVLLARTREMESSQKYCFVENRVSELMADAGSDDIAFRWALMTNAIRRNMRPFSANAARDIQSHRTINQLALQIIRPSWFRIKDTCKSLSAIRMENLVDETGDLVDGIASVTPPAPQLFASYEDFSLRCG